MKITKSQLQRIIQEELQQVMEQERTMAQQIARDDWLQGQAAEHGRAAEPDWPAMGRRLGRHAQRRQGYEVYEVSPQSPVEFARSGDLRRASMQEPKEREQISRRRGLRGPAAQQAQIDHDLDESLINDLTEAVLAKLTK